MTRRADARYFDRPVLEAAPALLDAHLVSLVEGERVAVRLTEVEAYDGADDPGSHAYRGRTARNATMFGPPGLVYVYFTYGMHFCANLVCGPPGQAHAVLLRAGEVVEGLATARRRRYGAPTAGGPSHGQAGGPSDGQAAQLADRRLASGPANLARTLGLGRAHDGVDTTAPDAPLWVELLEVVAPTARIRTGPRVGVAGAGGDARTYPWRFWLDGEPTVSAYRPAVKRVRRRPAG